MHGNLSEWITLGDRPMPALYVSPFAKSAAGGGDGDDDDDDDDDDGDGDDDDDDDGDDLADLSEDELRAELKKTRESLSKAGGSVKSKRDRIKKLTRELDEARKPKSKKKADVDDEPDLDEIRESARREGESTGTLRAKKAEAKAELLRAGVNPDRVAKAVGLLNLEDLDLDDDGLDGIDDEIADLRKSWPELFARKRTRRESVVGDGDRSGKERRPKPKTASEIAAERILGRA